MARGLALYSQRRNMSHSRMGITERQGNNLDIKLSKKKATDETVLNILALTVNISYLQQNINSPSAWCYCLPSRDWVIPRKCYVSTGPAAVLGSSGCVCNYHFGHHLPLGSDKERNWFQCSNSNPVHRDCQVKLLIQMCNKVVNRFNPSHQWH